MAWWEFDEEEGEISFVETRGDAHPCSTPGYKGLSRRRFRKLAGKPGEGLFRREKGKTAECPVHATEAALVAIKRTCGPATWRFALGRWADELGRLPDDPRYPSTKSQIIAELKVDYPAIAAVAAEARVSFARAVATVERHVAALAAADLASASARLVAMDRAIANPDPAATRRIAKAATKRAILEGKYR